MRDAWQVARELATTRHPNGSMNKLPGMTAERMAGLFDEAAAKAQAARA